MSKSILLIDDNPLDNSGYIDALKRHYKVDVAIRLTSAKRLIKSHHYDIIIIDVMMSTQQLKIHNELITGFAFYNQVLRLLDNQQEMFFLFWSYLEKDSFDDFFKDGVPGNVGFLHKDSFDVDCLLNKVNELVK